MNGADSQPAAGPQAAPAAATPAASAADESAAWQALENRAAREPFVQAWLTLLCCSIAQARRALLVMPDAAGAQWVPVAQWPDATADISLLAQAAERVLNQRRPEVLEISLFGRAGHAGAGLQIAQPVLRDGQPVAALALELGARPAQGAGAVLRQISWGSGWLIAQIDAQSGADLALRLARAADMLALLQTAQEHARLDQALLALVNALARRFGAQRASAGIVRRGRVEVHALSDCAWFDRRSAAIAALENAMDEAICQEAAAAHPLPDPAGARITVAQRELAESAGAARVLSVPLLCAGRPMGALTLEWDAAAVLPPDIHAFCAALGALLGPALEARRGAERWFAGSVPDRLRAWRDKLIGPRHAAWKVSALAALLGVLLLAFATGEFRVSARTVIEGAVQRAAVAPFDGYIAAAFARAGERVKQGDTLALLDDRDLKLEQTKLDAQFAQVSDKYHEALARRDRAALGMLAAQRNQVEAERALVTEKLTRARIVAPFDATVVQGDLSQMLGAPVEQGKLLFELAPLDAYRVILEVDERDIAHIAPGQQGELTLTGLAAGRLPFVVKNVTAVSTPREGRNYFRVEAELGAAAQNLRPNMEGVGKITAGRHKYLWMWTRHLVDWLRLTFWTWLP
ncbi:MAG: HlyD family efflux transporter periplasmic adaptor subunit [Rhodocyclaceae bacterium]|nr:HlyD family efflux transporter periplasmic adaptor subunit [Rhodocyclaceae bacterium]